MPSKPRRARRRRAVRLARHLGQLALSAACVTLGLGSQADAVRLAFGKPVWTAASAAADGALPDVRGALSAKAARGPRVGGPPGKTAQALGAKH